MRFSEIRSRLFPTHSSDPSMGAEEHRFDGGTSCYRPNRRRARDPQETAAAEPQIRSLHTGFTGMNPPEDGSYFGYAGNGNEAANGYTGNGYTAAGQTGYSRTFSNEPAPADNISYMNGNPAGQNAGQSFRQSGGQTGGTARILVMTSLKTCYEAIGYMKKEETLILSLDAIANDSEIIRCEDMLAGAAFTLGCSVRLLPGTGHLILIVPQGVTVLPEENRRARQAAPAAPSAPVSDGTGYYPQAEQNAYQPRRERRTSQNSQIWKNVGSTTRNNTGYYGQEPVPADQYTAFGGYGY